MSQDEVFNPFAAPEASERFDQGGASQGERIGPPWEKEGPGIRSFFDTVFGMVLRPGKTLARMRRTPSIGLPFAFGFLGLYLFALPYNLLMLAGIDLAPFANDQQLQVPKVLLFAWIFLIGPMVGMLMALVYSGFMHLLMRWQGYTEMPWGVTVRCIFYPMGSTAIWQLIPFVGPFIMVVQNICLQVWSLKRLHELSWWRAIVGWLSPIIVAFLAAFILFLGMAMIAILARG
ncbi:Yip1 domain protein [Planctomycetes bacterium Pan216]|uniref:Yip1 domain protein n=1 Tax=Kolteria novifilia TaxID=2527975 RepID=A0A518AXF1_9BACT|nr:Yip1 domain protein [Planctomycetes bacterium Pan216]